MRFHATFFVVLGFLGYFIAVFAQNTVPANSASSNGQPSIQQIPATQPSMPLTNQQLVLQQVLCPKPSDLVKNGLYWGTPTGGWKSYAESFDTGITSFIGAQWVGINVGKMICIYKGNMTMAFPVTVQNDALAQAPIGGAWGSDLGGYRNCHSDNITDCPFTVQKQVIDMQKVYESLDFFKGKTNSIQNNSNGSISTTPASQ